MRILKESEATKYLVRLDEAISHSKLAKTSPLVNLRVALAIDHAYLERLSRDESTRDLAILGISASGFPELPSLVTDIAKAYEELETVEENIGKSVYPLLDHLNCTEDMSAYKTGIEQVLSDFEKDQTYIKFLKKSQSVAKGLYTEQQLPNPQYFEQYRREFTTNWDGCIFDKPEKPGLLCFNSPTKNVNNEYGNFTGARELISGYLKYIDLADSTPILITFQRKITTNLQEILTDKEEELNVLPFSEEVCELLKPLSRSIREKILSIDYTNYTNDKFYEFIRLSSKIGTLLQHASTPPKTESRTTSKAQSSKTSWLTRLGLK